MKYIEDLRQALKELLAEDNKVYILGEDIAEPYGGAFKVTKGLSQEYSDRFIQTPMSEQGFTGLGIGMSLNGMKPIIEIMFGDFITLIADQVINHITKFSQMYDKDTCFVVRTPSGGYRGYGATHSQSIETLFLNVPGLEIISPSILCNPGNLLKKAINLKKPVLFIENKLDYSSDLLEAGEYKDLIEIKHLENNNWEMKRASIIDETSEITILTHGGMTKSLIEIQEKLFMEDEISVEIFNLTNISSIDYNELNKYITSDKLLTVEESCSEFGWGKSVVFNLLKIRDFTLFDVIGAKSSFIPASKNLEEYILPSKEMISERITEMVMQK